MNWLRRLLWRPPALSGSQRAVLAAYRDLAAPPLNQAVRDTRFVVLDVETSGLNPFRDRLLSIGAVVVRDGAIRLGEAMEVVLKQTAPSDGKNILVHGIDGTTQLAGQDPPEALAAFLAYAGKAPLVGYHVDFDRIMIERALRQELGMKPVNEWLDLARLMPALYPEAAARGRGLDYWLEAFSIENAARHNAVADALATAQLLQVALARAGAGGRQRYADLRRLDDDQGWLERTRKW
jgi:DNA polymerase-3 subunit epsilon